MIDATVAETAVKEEQKQDQKSSVVDGIDPIGAVLDIAGTALSSPACNAAAKDVADVAGKAMEATSEAAGSLLSDVVGGVGSLLDGV